MRARRGLDPSIEQRGFTEEARRGRLRPVLVPAPGYGGPDAPVNPEAVTVHQDAALYAGLIDPVQAVTHHFRPGFLGYLFVVHGAAQLVAGADGGELDEGGAAKVTGEPQVTIQARDAGAEVLLVETRGVDRSRAA